MPRFYFHLRNDLSVDDEEGTELPDLDAAHRRATDYAIDMAAASVRERCELNLRHRIEVGDESGGIVLTVTFGDAVTVQD